MDKDLIKINGKVRRIIEKEFEIDEDKKSLVCIKEFKLSNSGKLESIKANYIEKYKSLNYEQQYFYDVFENLIGVNTYKPYSEYSKSTVTRFEYDLINKRIITSKTELNGEFRSKTDFEYNSNNQKIKESIYGKRTYIELLYEYNDKNEVIQMKYSDGSKELYEYDTFGNQITIEEYYNDGRFKQVKRFEYNKYRDKIKELESLCDGLVFKYEYDSQNNWVKQYNYYIPRETLGYENITILSGELERTIECF